MVVLVLLAGVLLVVEVVLLARLVVDWTAVLAGAPSYGSVRARATRGIVSVTEPVLAPVRRVIRPVRLGALSVDLSFTVVFLAVVLVRALLLSVAGA